MVEGLVREATLADGVSPVGEHKYLKLHDGAAPVWAILAYDELPPTRSEAAVEATGAESASHVAPTNEQLVGYAQVLSDGAGAVAELVVRPSARRRGIGRWLLDAARERAARDGARELKLWAYGALPASAAIAARRGLVATRTLLQLELPLDDLPPEPNLDGYVVRTFDLAHDSEPWLDLHNEIFADHPENGRWSIEDVEARLRQPWFSAEDFLIAEALADDAEIAHRQAEHVHVAHLDEGQAQAGHAHTAHSHTHPANRAVAHGTMVGFNWLKRVPDAPPERPEGEIYIIGVAGTERGRGLGRSLALLGLHHLRREGLRACTLYVEGDNGPALGLYGALGFTVRHTHRCYTVALDDAGAARASARSDTRQFGADQAGAERVGAARSPAPASEARYS